VGARAGDAALLSKLITDARQIRAPKRLLG
jgi:hypothetical protein